MSDVFGLAVELGVNQGNLRTGLNSAALSVRQFGQKSQEEFRRVQERGTTAANGIRESWTKAARDSEKAQANFAANASKANKQAAAEAARTLREVQAARQEVVRDVSRGLLVTSAALSAGLVGIVGVTANFNKEISTLGGVANASAQQLKDLRSVVLEAGQATVFSASEAAKGATELARAGVSTQNIIRGGLVGALNLAAAGQLGLSEASEIAANTMNVFKLRGDQVNHVADLLAAAANSAAGGVKEMGYSLAQSALVAKQTGLNLEDTVGTLALFASNALIGSDAGTSLRTMLLRLNPQSAEAANSMRALGLDFYDANGNFIGITKTAGLLQEKLKGLTQEQRTAALSTIFGQDAIRGATVLYEAGAEGVQKYIDTVNDSGAASRLAARNMDNLSGDLEKLKGSFEVALIGTGEQADGVMRNLVQTTDLMVSAYGQLPPQVQGGAFALLSFAAAGTGAIGVVGTLIPKYQALSQALQAMGAIGPTLATSLRYVTIGIGAVGAAAAAGLLIYGLYAQKKAEAKAITDSFTDALRAEKEGQTGASNAAISAELGKRKLNDTMKELGVSQADYLASLRGDLDATARVTDEIFRQNPALKDNAENRANLREAIEGNRKSFSDLVVDNNSLFESENKQGNAIRKLIGAHNDLAPKVEKSIKDAENEKQAKDDVRKSALDMGASLGLSGAQLEKFTQTISGQKDDLSDLAVSLNFTREQLVAIGDGSEEAGAKIGKAVEDAMKASSQSFDKFGDVVAKFGGDTATSAAGIQQFYKDTIKKSNDFISNINKGIEQGINPGLISRLLQAGPEAAGPVIQAMVSGNSKTLIGMVNESEKKLEEINSLAVQMTRITTLAASSSTDQLAKDVPAAMRIVQQNYKDGGKASADALSKELGIGLADVQRITAEFGISVVSAGNQVRAAFNNAPITVNVTGATQHFGPGDAPGGVTRFKFAEGGIENHTAQIAQGQTPYRVWAEPETGGEAYIPLSQSKRARSTEILHTVAGHFGLDVLDPRNGGGSRRFAGGGIFGVFPPVAPRGSGAISQSAYAVQSHEYELLKQFAEAQSQVGQGWQAVTKFLQSKGIPFNVTSTTGGAHVQGSLHYAGKAVDLVGPNMLAIFKALETASTSLQELFYDPAGYSYKRGQRIGPIGGHSDHVHAATYDEGGWAQPGWTMMRNSSGRPEPVLTAAQWDRLFSAMESNRGGNVAVYADLKSTQEVARQVVRKQRK